MTYQVENFLNIIKYAIYKTALTELPELQEPVDWSTLANMAKAHNLLALFHEVAHRFPQYRESADYEKNAQIAVMTVAQQIKKTEAFLELYRAFVKEDLHPIVVKGIICRRLYGEYAEHRPSGDEDILVTKQEFQRVKSVLEKNGYECEFKKVTDQQLENVEHISFYNPEVKLVIEVHINLLGRRSKVRMQMSDYFQEVFNNSHTQNHNEVRLTVMSHTAHFLFLVLHSFKHFTASGVGIRQIMDILLYQEKYESDIQWCEVEKVLEENNLLKYLGDIQYMGTYYFKLKLKQIFPSCCPEMLLEDMLEVGVFGKRERADMVAMNITLGALDQRNRGVLSLLRAAFPPKSHILGEAPYLNDKPWLLLLAWVKRWMRFLKTARTYKGNLIIESARKSNKRMSLLKKYGL